MDIVEKIERLSGNNPLDRKKLKEMVEEGFETAMLNLEQLNLLSAIPIDKRNKIRNIIKELQKIKLDVIDDMEK